MKARYTPLANFSGHPASHLRQYAEFIRRAKIAIFDTSFAKYALKKFSEVAMSGTVIASDIPREFEVMFRDFVIPLKLSDTEADISRTLVAALQDVKALEDRARRGLDVARRHFTCRRRVSRLLEQVHAVRSRTLASTTVSPHRASCVISWSDPKQTWSPECDEPCNAGGPGRFGAGCAVAEP